MKIHFYKLRPRKHPFPLFAWIIMLFQGMNPFKENAFSHMGMGYLPKTAYAKVADVNFGGFRITDKINFFKGYTMVDVKTRVFDITEEEFKSWLMGHSETSYDFAQIFGLIAKQIKLKKHNFTGNDLDSLVCSELILSFLIKFDKLKVNDSDDWDLNMTWDAI